jgi:hypothetical protein
MIKSGHDALELHVNHDNKNYIERCSLAEKSFLCEADETDQHKIYNDCSETYLKRIEFFGQPYSITFVRFGPKADIGQRLRGIPGAATLILGCSGSRYATLEASSAAYGRL